jgi:hypothetical protein
MLKLSLMEMMTLGKVESLIDEGLRVSLVETAFFDGELEIPHIDEPENSACAGKYARQCSEIGI